MTINTEINIDTQIESPPPLSGAFSFEDLFIQSVIKEGSLRESSRPDTESSLARAKLGEMTDQDWRAYHNALQQYVRDPSAVSKDIKGLVADVQHLLETSAMSSDTNSVNVV